MLKAHTRIFGNVAVVCLQGRIVNGETASLQEAVNAEVRTRKAQSGLRTVVLDLARVSAIDASGLGVLLDLRRLTEAEGVRLKLMNTSKLVRRVLEVTRLDSVFEVAATNQLTFAATRTSPTIPFAACA